MPTLATIVYKPAGLGDDPRDHYLRVAVNEATLLAGRGIMGDLKGTPNRPLNVMSAETLEAMRAEGFKTGPGQMGEQIVVRGLDVAALAPDERLQIGPAAVIQVIKLRTGCDRFEAIQGHSPESAAGRLGILARVIAGGPIRVGDDVVVLTSETATSV
jgi:MOSC domain-containing protein YiiM